MPQPQHRIMPPPNGTMAYAAGVLGGLACGSSRPSDWPRYFGESTEQLATALQEIVSLLTELENAGVGSGRPVTVKFLA